MTSDQERVGEYPLRHWAVRGTCLLDDTIADDGLFEGKCADTFAANERTFLGYLRTSVVLSMTGTFIAQFYRLQHAPDPSKVFGYYLLGKPLSAIFQCAALCMVSLGCSRFWRQQGAMAIGKVHAGGWELSMIMVGSFLVSRRRWAVIAHYATDTVMKLLIMMLAVHLGVEAYKTIHPDE